MNISAAIWLAVRDFMERRGGVLLLLLLIILLMWTLILSRCLDQAAKQGLRLAADRPPEVPVTGKV